MGYWHHLCTGISVIKIHMLQEKTDKPLMLVFPFGYLSHYLRCLTLAQHFRASFTILFAADKKYNPYVQDAGFQTFECAAMDADHALDCVQKFDFSWLNEQTLEAAFKDQVRVINTLKPAVVLGDASPTLRMAATATDVFYISVINGYMSKYFAGLRTLSVTHPAYPLVKKLPVPIAAMLTRHGEALAFRAVHRPFKKIRSKWHLPSCKYYLDEMEGDMNLIPDLLSLFPQQKLPDHYRVIGPLFHQPTQPVKGWIMPALNAAKQTLFVSMGSTGAWKSVAFLNDPAFAAYNIIAAGDHQKKLFAQHIIHVPFADAGELYPQVDLVLCHGGNGSIYQSLAYGIPVLCWPAHFEQEWNVAALEREGLGKNMTAVKPVPEIRKLIDQWICKKGTTLFEHYQHKIQHYQTLLPDGAAALAATWHDPILNNNN